MVTNEMAATMTLMIALMATMSMVVTYPSVSCRFWSRMNSLLSFYRSILRFAKKDGDKAFYEVDLRDLK